MSRRKLLTNIVLVLICGTITLSIPVIVKQFQKPTDAASNPNANGWVLTSIFIGDHYQNLVDSCAVWQIEKHHGDTVITWPEIYVALGPGNPLTMADENLLVSAYGIIYPNLNGTDYQALLATGYRTTVTYQGLSCTLTLG